MPLLNAQFIAKEISSTGNTCTITEVSISFGSDEYRTKTETTTDQTGIKCWVQILSEEDDAVKQGDARAGDLIFWFDSDQESYCVQGNKITFDSKTYQIYNVHKFDILGTTYLVECRTRKI